ncbi:hypothetical protein GALL_521570 [mine drainage metagenome]|uniref:Uncharacterized protein n=1 Tax=mine drainage metagenome TaxID=410659 RepID=A0A1J5PLU4_9ZZZZ
MGVRAVVAGQLDQLVGDHPIALHHVARHRFVAGVGRVGDDLPAVRGGQPRGLEHRLVVVAGHAHDLGAERGDRRLALGADLGVQHDHAAAADRRGGRGQRAAVVAVGGADHDQLAQRVGAAPGEQLGGVDALRRQAPLDQPQQRVRRAQRLEAAQRRARRFVLHVDCGHADFGGQTGQRDHRRGPRRQLAPAGQQRARGARRLQAEDVAQRRVVVAAHGARVRVVEHRDGAFGDGGRGEDVRGVGGRGVGGRRFRPSRAAAACAPVRRSSARRRRRSRR